MTMKIKTGDQIKVLVGKDKGKTGKVLQVFPRLRKLSVEGINVMTRHLRSRQGDEKGQKIQFPAPLHQSKIMLICPKCNKPTRVGKIKGPNQKNTRVCKRCQATI